MKVLHLLYESKGDIFGIGGVGIRAYEIYRRLKDRHQITLLCKKYPGARDGLIDGLEHRFVGTESWNLAKTLLSYAYHASRYVRNHGGGFDVIVEEFSPAIPTFLGFYGQKPVILQIQGYTGKRYFEKYRIPSAVFLSLTERYLPRFYRNIIVVSEATRMRYNLSGPSEKVVVLSNGFDPEILRSEPSESDYILYLGRIDIHHKGLDILLDAYAEFHRAFPHLRLVIAGDGRDEERLRALIKELPRSVQAAIELTGWIEGERKIALLRDALFLVMPSRYETQGIVALEAMACAKPVICSAIPELRYIEESGAGISFPPEQSGLLAKAMIDLAGNHKRKAMGMNGRGWVKAFTWDAVSEKYERFLLAVIQTQTAGP